MIKIEGTIKDIELEYVTGIYKDREKPGYWVRTVKDNKTIKTYHLDLSYPERVVITAAGRFNQTLSTYKLRKHNG